MNNILIKQIESGNIISLNVQPIDGEANQNVWYIYGKMSVDGKEVDYIYSQSTRFSTSCLSR